MRRHVLIANVHFAPHSYGGATLVAEQVAAELARRGHRVSALSAAPQAGLPPYAILRTTPLPGIDSYLIALPPNRPAQLSDDNPALAAALAPLVARLAPDIAHLHCVQDLGAGLVPMFRGLGIPTILSFHDFWWLCARQFMIRPDGRHCGQDRLNPATCTACSGADAPARQARLAALARQADLRTAPGRFAARLHAENGTGPVTVWENGILPPGPPGPARQGPVTFGYLGGPSPIKGWPQLRAALPLIGRADFALHLIDAGHFAPWWRAGMLHGLPGTCRLLPRFAPERADDFYNRIDVLLFPSQWRETFGLALREALARGLRVIRTEGGGQAEHPPAPGVRTLPIGATPERLAAEMHAVIEEIHAGAPRRLPPLPMRSFAEQATELDRLVEGLLTHPANAATRAG